MNPGCINHPDRPATHTCAQCDSAICFDCMEIVKGKHYCTACEAAEVQAGGGTSVADPGAAPKKDTAANYPTGVLPGIAYGMLVGLATALIWEKMYFYLHVQFLWLNIVMCCAVGAGVLIGTRTGGIVPGLIGGLVSLATVFLGHWMLIEDLIAADAANYHAKPIPLTLPIFFVVARHLSILHWGFVLAGVVFGGLLPWKFGDPGKPAAEPLNEADKES